MYSRSERLKELFREEIAAALRGVKDPGLAGLLTITDVELSNDGKTLMVYWSVIGSAHERQSTADALERAAPYLRQVMRKRLHLKLIPKVAFVFDDTPARAARIDKLFLQIEEEDKPS